MKFLTTSNQLPKSEIKRKILPSFFDRSFDSDVYFSISKEFFKEQKIPHRLYE